MMFRTFIKKVINRTLLRNSQIKYSQFGEDAIVSAFFNLRGINKISYIDIGANEPKFISNTYLFYEQGGKGVLVEPNPFLSKKLLCQRPKDIVINKGISIGAEKAAEYYMFNNKYNGLNTFSKKEANHWETVGMKNIGKIKIEKILSIPMVSINSIFNDYFYNSKVNLLSIDVEGLDFEILKTLDFQLYKPEVICVETLKYDENQKGYKNIQLIDFIISKGYFLYADTHVNSIFVLNSLS